MKKFLLTLGAALAVGSVYTGAANAASAAAPVAASPATSATAATTRSVRVEVNGMVCAFCASAIDKKLSALPETRAVYVNLHKRIVALELKDGRSTNLDKVKAEIKDAGYDVVKIAETGQTLTQIRASVK